MLSIICAYNNKKILNDMLLNSIEQQDFKNYELILVNANEYNFKSAAETLNYGASISKGDVLLFIHQDISFPSNTLKKIYEYSLNNDYEIAGVAGTIGYNKYIVSSSVRMGKKNRIAGLYNDIIRNAYTLDECVLIVKKEKFSGFSYLGNTWHFYGVEYSMKVFDEKKVLLFPIDIYHLSPGYSLDETYFSTLKVLAKKYQNYKIIRTCMGYFKNNKFLSIYCIYRKLKIRIKKMFRIKDKR